ncbi:MAG TPA: ATP-binding cassette domain-containing protein [Candidatus Acidoferrales bacterium]|nr:ATP-binding cassette domain-containing protein [Candidatus Acidoferrales bacterium]
MTYRERTGKRVVAVDGVTFEVGRGEKFVVIGPSGCGKTTLLKAIGGFMRPSAGRLTIEGRPIASAGPDRMVVFQDFDQLFPWHTIRGNVAYALRVTKRGVSKEESLKRADAVLELVGIGHAADRYPHQLSGGMKQRAAIARAIALEPTLLLLDEPFGALDAITRTRMQRELLAIHARLGLSIVLITHSIEEAAAIGDRVLVLTRGPGRVREIVDVKSAGADAVPYLHQLLDEGAAA